MRVYVKTDPDNQTLKRPVYAGDAGYDLIAYSDPVIVGKPRGKSKTEYETIDYIEYDTNVKVAPEVETQFYSLVYPRSSISRYNLVLANSVGVIDSGYRGPIKLCFRYIIQPEDLKVGENGSIVTKINKEKIYKKGDKIGQLVWAGHNKLYVEFTHELPLSDRGYGGFGSTGV